MVSSSIEQIDRHWFFRYKIYHIPFWAFYHFFWGVAEFGLEFSFANLYSARFSQYLFYIFLPAAGVYFNLYYLLPKYLGKGMLARYIIYLVMCIVVTSALLLGSYFISSYISGKPLAYFCASGLSSWDETVSFFITQVLSTTAGVILLGLSIKLAKNWSVAQQRQQLLEKEKLESELKFLRYQFNPHFLFNTINSIFFLIHKAPGSASDALAKFSDLLRYQLYECNEKRIPLTHEVAYLENFIALERLRRNQNFRIDVDFDLKGGQVLGIAPFILMPFVENAFKHASTQKNQLNWISAKLRIGTGHQLEFEILNSKCPEEEGVKEPVRYGGIGLQNVKRRLDLIYPKLHALEVEDSETVFSIKLKLMLSEMDMPHLTHQNTQVASQI